MNSKSESELSVSHQWAIRQHSSMVPALTSLNGRLWPESASQINPFLFYAAFNQHILSQWQKGSGRWVYTNPVNIFASRSWDQEIRKKTKKSNWTSLTTQRQATVSILGRLQSFLHGCMQCPRKFSLDRSTHALVKRNLCNYFCCGLLWIWPAGNWVEWLLILSLSLFPLPQHLSLAVDTSKPTWDPTHRG